MARPYRKGGKQASAGGATKCVKHTTPCRFYQRGKCSDRNCPYLHIKAGVVSAAASSGPSSLATALEVITAVLKLFFEKHLASVYDAGARALDLSRLATNSELRNIKGSINFNARTFCDALSRCIVENFHPPPAILSLDDNGISSVYSLSHAMMAVDLHLAVQALSLADNRIDTCDFAKDLKNFTNLVELNLLGNAARELKEYKARVKKFLPALVILDTAPLQAPPLALPWPAFYHSAAGAGSTGVNSSSGASPVRHYDTVQQSILQFIRTSVLNPLEQGSGSVSSGSVAGVDIVSEAYALTASFSLTLSCPEAAVRTPIGASSTSSPPRSEGEAGSLRGMVRDIVGLRLRQTESDHNLMSRHGGKVTQVAVGRTQVCARLEHLLYPRTFAVGHYIHASPDVAVLDNNGFGPAAPAQFNEPVAVVTLHGAMVWRHRLDDDVLRITRNFTRVLTVAMLEEGSRWQVVNDMVTLYPSRSLDADTDAEACATVAAISAGVRDERLPGTGLSLHPGLLADLHSHDVVFCPATDPRRVARMARRFRVPVPVVATVSRAVASDAELASILADVADLPLTVFEQCAQLAQGDALAGVLLCRLQSRYGVDAATAGVKLLTQYGLNWAAIVHALPTQ